jgi:hypothetical protein
MSEELVHRVARRFLAAGNLASLFQKDKYYPVEIVGFGHDDKGYLSKSEIDAGKAGFKEAVAKRKDWNKKYNESLQSKNELYHKLLKLPTIGDGNHDTLVAWIKDQEANLERSERAASMADVRATFTPAEGPGFYMGHALILGRDVSGRAWSRAVEIHTLESRGSAKEHAAFVATGAEIADKPGFGEWGNETLKAIKWLGAKRKNIIEKSMKTMGDALDAAYNECIQKFPDSDGGELMREVQRLELKWRKY